MHIFSTKCLFGQFTSLNCAFEDTEENCSSFTLSMFTKTHIGKYTLFFYVVTSKPFMKFAYAGTFVNNILTHITHERAICHNPMIQFYRRQKKKLDSLLIDQLFSMLHFYESKEDVIFVRTQHFYRRGVYNPTVY